MAVRLNKVIQELNVGSQTVRNFLEKKGVPLENESPNAKLTDEQYSLLTKEFGADKNSREEYEKGRQEKERLKQEKKMKIAEPYRPSSPPKQEFKLVGHIDLTPKVEKPKVEPEKTEVSNQKPNAGKSVEETPKVVVEQQPEEKSIVEPVATDNVVEPQPSTQEVETKATEEKPQLEEPQQEEPVAAKEEPQQDVKPADETPKESEEPTSPTPATNGIAGVKIVGTIDLNTINTKTRPDKKSKAEKRKEREEKERQRKERMDASKATGEGEGSRKRKRNRIGKERVDVNAEAAQQTTDPSKKLREKEQRQNQQQNAQQQGKKRKKKSQKVVEPTDEEISKQVKETLARLTSKQMKKGVKYRKDKRDAIHNKMQEMEAEENAESKVLKLTEYVTANELATMMDVPVTQVIGTCMQLGIMVSINQRLDAETINLVAEEFGYTTTYVSEDVSHAIEEETDKEEDLEPRAPIITVMGHVDHGKTSLLDYIRKTNVIAGEAGGITQHIGAYNVKMPNGKRITFLDTPGHEAFTAMRARGAQVTDIAIIIIAADDDIMPQTKEAISHAVAANVPMVFAINKIDKPGADPEKIKEQLAQMNYLVEDWGGKYQSQDISAKKGVNVDLLMEKVLLEAEMLELKANPNRKATGSVIESSLDKGRGYVATVLVQNGTLRQGDIVLAGTSWGKIKAMFNERGKRIDKVSPAEPALILGLNGAPTAGDTFHVMNSEQEAREIANKREQLKREQGIRTTKRKGLEDIAHDIAVGGVQDLNLIVKGDVDGSIEALSDSLIKLSTEKIQVNVIYKAVGQISESDVSLAKASDAIIIGFQVRPSQAARRLAEQEGVDIRLYSIIYDTIEEIKSAMEGMLEPEIREEYTGTAEVKQVYKITKVGTVAGAWVTDGKVHRADKVHVVRDGIVIYTGSINALKRFKDDVKEVGLNMECGISIVNYNDIREGDILETFTEIEVKQKL